MNKPKALKLSVSPTVSGNIVAQMDYGTALDFEASNSDYVSIPDSDGLSFGNGGTDLPFSISGWLRPEVNANLNVIVGKYVDLTHAEYVVYIDAANKLVVNLTDPDLSNSLTEQSNLVLTDAVWNHFAMTYDGSKAHSGIKLYINGVLSTTTDSSAGTYAGMTNTTSVLELGRNNATNYFDGYMSEIAIHDVELTSTEIALAFAGNNKMTGIEAFYQLNEGAGNPVDSSGNGHNATSNNADWVTSGKTVSAAGITNLTSYSIYADSTNFKLDANGTNVGSIALAGSTVPNNAHLWNFMSQAYISASSVNVTVGGNLIAQYKPNTIISGSILPDRTGNGNTGTIVWGTNSGIEISYGEMTSYQSMVATSSNTTGGFSIGSSLMPKTWFAMGENVEDLPFYDMVHDAVVAMDFPDDVEGVQTIYFIIIIGIAFAVFLGTVVFTRSALMAYLGLLIVLFIGSSMTIVPMWIPFVLTVVGFGIMYLYRQVAY